LVCCLMPVDWIAIRLVFLPVLVDWGASAPANYPQLAPLPLRHVAIPAPAPLATGAPAPAPVDQIWICGSAAGAVVAWPWPNGNSQSTGIKQQTKLLPT
jgi:hypothetical protein